jgi:hypothetical protein
LLNYLTEYVSPDTNKNTELYRIMGDATTGNHTQLHVAHRQTIDSFLANIRDKPVLPIPRKYILAS